MSPMNEWKRKLLHLVLGTILLILYAEGLVSATHLWFLAGIGALVSLGQYLSPLAAIAWFLDRFDREESIPGRGAITFIAGLAICALFPREIALAAMAMLVWGDGTAALVGTYVGQRRLWQGKTVEGSISFLLFGFAAAWAFVSTITAYSAAIVGTIVELIPLPKGSKWNPGDILDDNILVPLIVGIVLTLSTVFF